ncbi:MAG: cobalt-precorrin-5B (C(1))-methyltransferase CbiD [Vallitalea sp.]|nr:cobalt-precorrin-5B (C(1))-methyltransferase CbiD [Vallitalea sp.]
MENSKYIYKGCKKLRTGYTTGSCAAAATKAAAYMIKNQKPIDKVKINTPKGYDLNLSVHKSKYNETSATCCIIKDSGDDPDITNGAEVFSTVTLRDDNIINISGGKGVGIVTKEGLQVPINQHAINPTPMKMIKQSIIDIFSDGTGVDVIISIPKGEELAKKTFNPKLGIVGGLSVLGTTGIVEPMSEDALKETIALELRLVKQKAVDYVILVPGNIGEKLVSKYIGNIDVPIVKISNYLGFALEKCAELNFNKIILAGHIGKLIKPAGGIYYTHSRVSTTRLEILTAYLGIMGMDKKHLIRVMDCITTDEADKIIREQGYEQVYNNLVNKAANNCEGYIYDNIEIGVIYFNMSDVLAVSDKVDRLIGEIKHNE